MNGTRQGRAECEQDTPKEGRVRAPSVQQEAFCFMVDILINATELRCAVQERHTTAAELSFLIVQWVSWHVDPC